jgi:2-succinyl-5-enolpyruvyl-6-hydroxy-3-cyclohexene-1-carboxylate synthase
VHVNLAYREPLVPTGEEPVEASGRPDDAPWLTARPSPRPPRRDVLDRLATVVASDARGVLVAGWGAQVQPDTAQRFAEASGWPVLADPLSGLRNGPHAISTYDALLRVESFAARMRPHAALRIGAPPTGKPVAAWLDGDVEQWLVDTDGVWLDPAQTARERVVADAEVLLAELSEQLADGPGEPARHPAAGWLDEWLAAEQQARRAIDELIDGWEEPFEGRIARDVVAALPPGARLFVASSMPVRDVDSFAAARDGVELHANRGVNGIDGFVSTVLGGAAASNGPVVALLGDLCFLHDSNGLLGAARRGVDATLVVVDNDGGGDLLVPPAGHRGS